MTNFGKYLASISAKEMQTSTDIANVSRAILERLGNGSMQGMVSAANIKLLSMTKGTYTLNVNVVMDLKEVSKPSTKKKLKKDTVKARGTNSSSKASKSAKGAKLKSK
jgi:hypothetical protein